MAIFNYINDIKRKIFVSYFLILYALSGWTQAYSKEVAELIQRVDALELKQNGATLNYV